MSIPNWIVPLQMHVETGNSLAGKSSGSGFLASAAFPARRASGIFASVPPLQRRLRAGFAPGFLLSSRSEKRETCAVFHYTDGAESCQERFFLGGPRAGSGAEAAVRAGDAVFPVLRREPDTGTALTVSAERHLIPCRCCVISCAGASPLSSMSAASTP